MLSGASSGSSGGGGGGFSPSGGACGGGLTLKIWTLSSSTLKYNTLSNFPPSSIFFNPNGSLSRP